MSGPDFLHRDVPRLGKRVHRLGLTGTHGINDAGIRAAIDQGINYVLWTRPRMASALRDAIRRDRERLVIATGPVIGHFRFTIRRGAEKTLQPWEPTTSTSSSRSGPGPCRPSTSERSKR